MTSTSNPPKDEKSRVIDGPYTGLAKRVPAGWSHVLTEAAFWARLENLLNADAAEGRTVYPPVESIFAALEDCPSPAAVRVVILGMDPYPGEGQAEGRCFSVPVGVEIPCSLRNIFHELSTDISGFHIPNHGSLRAWSQQGVLLLNSSLTVRHGKPGSHLAVGWKQFTFAALRAVAHAHAGKGVIVLAWGQDAQRVADAAFPSSPGALSEHVILRAAHPSGKSCKGFFGCGCFSQCNRILESRGLKPIDWHLT